MGRRAIITAGASGIGRVVAEVLAAAGYRVAICDVDAAALEAARQTADFAHTAQCDVTDAEAMDAFVADAVTALDGLDTVIANAGTGGPTASLEDVALTEWRATLAVNLDGTFNLLKPCIPHLKVAGGGSVILMSSVAGRLGYPLRAPYAVAKWGVIGLKETLAMELGPHGIRVNAILPGSVAGDRMDRVLAAKAEATGMTIDQAHEAEVANVSMRAMVEARDVANTIAFLASDAGAAISGQSIGVCGNYETLR